MLLGLIVVGATLESAFALCLGCTIFGVLMRWGVIPEEVCERCNNLGFTTRAAESRSPAPTAS